MSLIMVYEHDRNPDLTVRQLKKMYPSAYGPYFDRVAATYGGHYDLTIGQVLTKIKAQYPETDAPEVVSQTYEFMNEIAGALNFK